MTIHDLAANTRRVRLRNPLPQAPTPEQVFHTVLSKVQRGFNRLSNTGKPWATGTATVPFPTTFTQTGYSEPFLLNLPTDAGKIITIVNDYSANSFSPLSNVVFEPEIVGIGDMFSSMSISWFGWGACRVGIYRDIQGNWYGVTWGYLTNAQNYKIIYSIGDWMSTAGLENSVILSEHAAVFETDAGLELLDAAEWTSDDEKNEKKRLSILPGLTRAYELANQDFERYIGSMRQPKLVVCSSGISFD